MASSPKIKYQPLGQWGSSDEDESDEGFEENVLYDSRLVRGPSMGHHRRDVFELEKLGQPRPKQSVLGKNSVSS